MKTNTLRVFQLASLILIAGLAGCRDQPAFLPNNGSALQALNAGMSLLSEYAREHGTFPKAQVNLTDIKASDSPELPDEFARALQYGGNDSLTLQSPKDIILLRFAYPTRLTGGKRGFYCGLLSGEIVILPASEAILGSACPAEARRIKF